MKLPIRAAQKIGPPVWHACLRVSRLVWISTKRNSALKYYEPPSRNWSKVWNANSSFVCRVVAKVEGCIKPLCNDHCASVRIRYRMVLDWNRFWMKVIWEMYRFVAIFETFKTFLKYFESVLTHYLSLECEHNSIKFIWLFWQR